MSLKNIKLKNSEGQELSAKLELPDNRKAHNYAIFAHCFTCNKNFKAVKNITHSLNESGFGVLLFDFTGLGQSEGDFSETNFTSNISDLESAAEFLEKEYEAPSLLIGHSLGGTAVIFAAHKIDSVKAVATVAAPSSPAHVKNLLKDDIDKIRKKGKTEVNIGGRPFNISEHFLDDIDSKNMKSVLKKLRKALIVLHSPQDSIVGIENAQELYEMAHHPKSFISLDGADHLLSNKKDSSYTGKVIAGWAERYLEIPEPETFTSKHQVAVSLGNEGFTSNIIAGKHRMTADEPEDVGGNDFGPSPYDFVSSGLGACTAMTLRMYANRKKWDLQKVVVHLDHKKDYPKDDSESEQKIDIITRNIEIKGDLDEAQRNRLLEIANKCPVHRTLQSKTVIESKLL
ncbi:MAG: alpha/beta fold hydrolase [Chitinophagales bacterium]